MKDRIRQLMESQNLSQTSFAEKLQISPASLSSIFNDRTKPTLNHVDAIVKCFPRVNLQWLLYGKGEMFLSNQDDQPDNGSSTENENHSDSLFPEFISSTPQETTNSNNASFSSPNTSRREIVVPKIIDKPQRMITEIRIFYDDHTWETFIPKK